MGNEIQVFLKRILSNYAENIEEGKKKKLDVSDLEQKVKEKFRDIGEYRKNGGYKVFAESMIEEIIKGTLLEINASKNNKRIPELKQSMWILGKKKRKERDIQQLMFEFSDELAIDSKKWNKKFVSAEEYKRIKKVYQFLKEKKNEILFREERSLMLFKDVDTEGIEAEKYLSYYKGKAFLKRIGLTFDDIKCKKYSLPFDYWKPREKRLNDVCSVLIIEGLATYRTIIGLMEEEHTFTRQADMVIWGYGYRILSSFEYMEELFGERTDIDIKYFGDLDPEGFTIYCQLKERYENYSISLEETYYQFILEQSNKFASKIGKEQHFIRANRDKVVKELEKSIPFAKTIIETLWKEKKRVPQEALNRETVKEKSR
ncbi:Wadjet anti-phage system protein JetD domain-containing protein [Fredinandcohnia humi]